MYSGKKKKKLYIYKKKTDLETMCGMDWRRGSCRETRYERDKWTKKKHEIKGDRKDGKNSKMKKIRKHNFSTLARGALK